MNELEEEINLSKIAPALPANLVFKTDVHYIHLVDQEGTTKLIWYKGITSEKQIKKDIKEFLERRQQ